ncbi:30S ribosomal protein S17 [bacterium]|jgi:small subunit ribosomal protein S17|nr:30S ribosomal protein S17 [bacterium]MDP6571303.1 30S ribosomal protein S17 [Patescibacteria group bacterium]|tara:strand:- start:5089 stop:5364 length:276 start_codon:yes stop_codon:yes gene_type:complete
MEQAKTTDKPKIKRHFQGQVVSTAMQNTVMVKVDRVKVHPRYRKRYTVSKRYACDYRKDDLKVGDKVIIEEIRPISKTKRWRVISNQSQEK